MKLILMLTVLLSTQLFAKSGGGGNGGDVLICLEKTILLDLYESQIRDWEIKMFEKSISEIVNVFYKRFFKLDSFRASKFKKYSDELLRDLEAGDFRSNQVSGSVTFTTDELEDIDDSAHLSIPQGCYKKQLVIQQQKFNDLTKYQTRYIFNSILWSKLDDLNKAMTIIHEALYRLHIEERAFDSRFTRLLNGYILAHSDLTVRDYLEFLSGSYLGGIITETSMVGYTLPKYSKLKDMFLNEQSTLYLDSNDEHDTYYFEGALKEENRSVYENRLKPYNRWNLKSQSDINFYLARDNKDSSGAYFTKTDYLYFISLQNSGKVKKVVQVERIFQNRSWYFHDGMMKRWSLFNNGAVAVKNGSFFIRTLNFKVKSAEVCSDQFTRIKVKNYQRRSNQSGCLDLNFKNNTLGTFTYKEIKLPEVSTSMDDLWGSDNY